MRLKDSKYNYVVVCARYYNEYHQNAFIEIQAQTNSYDNALRIKRSFENADNETYLIVSTLTEKVKRLCKKHANAIRLVEIEDDLVDDCKYMVYWKKGWTDGELEESCYPCKTLKECAEFIDNVIYKC